MIVCKALNNKRFDSKEILFKELKENKQIIYDTRKATIKKDVITELPLIKDFDYTKAPFEMKDGFVYAVINSTNIMDSHDDVHGEDIWNKSAKEQNGKTYFVADHKMNVDGIVVDKQHVNIQLYKTTFRQIGVELEGKTTILVYEMPISEFENDKLKAKYEKGQQLQNSISMEYVSQELAINSTAKEYAEEYEVYKNNIDKVANKEAVEKQGYFFYVPQAKIRNEGSAVPFGSNSATPVFFGKNIVKAVSNTSTKTESEPSKDTQEIISFIKNKKFI